MNKAESPTPFLEDPDILATRYAPSTNNASAGVTSEPEAACLSSGRLQSADLLGNATENCPIVLICATTN